MRMISHWEHYGWLNNMFISIISSDVPLLFIIFNALLNTVNYLEEGILRTVNHR